MKQYPRIKQTGKRGLAEYKTATILRSDRSTSTRGKLTDASQLLTVYEGYVGLIVDSIAQIAATTPFDYYVDEHEARVRRRSGAFRHERYRRVSDEQRAFMAGEYRHETIGRLRVSSRIADYVANAEGNLYKVEDSRFRAVMDRPASPSIITGQQLQQFLYVSLLLTGNAYLYMPEPKGDEEYMVLPLLPQYVGIRAGDRGDGLVESYFYGRDRSGVQEFDAHEIVHMRHTIGMDPYFGRGPLHNAALRARAMLQADIAENARWENGARPDYAIKLDQGVSPDVVEQIREQIEGGHRGPSQSGEFFIGQGVEFQNLGWSPREMEYLEGTREGMKLVAAAFKYPMTMINRDTSNRASAESGDIALRSDAVLPLNMIAADYFTHEVATRLGYAWDAGVVMFENPVPTDLESAKRIALEEVKNGLRTPLDYMRQFGMLEHEKPENIGKANVLYFNGVPLGEDPLGGFGLASLPGESLAVDPEPLDADPVSPNVRPQAKVRDAGLDGAQMDKLISIAEKVQLGVLPLAAGKAIAQVSFPGIDQSLIDNVFDNLTEGSLAPLSDELQDPEDIEELTDDPNQGRLFDDTGATEGEGVATGGEADEQRTSSTMINDMRPPAPEIDTRDNDRAPGVQFPTPRISELLASFEGDLEKWFTDAITNGLDDAGRLTPQAESALDAVLDRHVEAILREGGLEAVGSLGLDTDDFEIGREVVDAYKVSYLSTLPESLHEVVDTAIREGVEQGKTQSEVVENLLSELPEDYPKFAAERIARTETARALELGSVEGFAEAGIEQRRFQLSVGACPVCVAFEQDLKRDGRDVVSMREPFRPAGYSFLTPEGLQTLHSSVFGSGIHPNCRCGYLAVLPDNDERSSGVEVQMRMTAWLGAIREWATETETETCHAGTD